ncbi:MAG: Asp-tRNA(Asn)/Glu-tRNA(Gln) amidotransferase subunit GatC [Pseudomonadales bacterium]|jgi:aspartyl-tRNA(Asn)/glutamyl-tRNA(Gln) amidotransferase subunit C|tara:strand:- start:6573 stop:6860 length:288 start_codon:yes stop_codon:yes gene_type:complete
MIVDKDVVLNIAELAQLQIEDDEVDHYVDSLGRILQLVEEMQSVDTQGVEPVSNPLDGIQRLREDRVTEEDQRELFLANAPESEQGLFLVPRVVE